MGDGAVGDGAVGNGAVGDGATWGGPGAVVAVEDPDDDRLAAYRDLREPARRARVEAAEGVFVVEGRVALRQLLASPVPVVSLLVDDHQARAVPELVAAVAGTGAPVYLARRDVVARTVGFSLHRGVVALARRPGPGDPAAIVAAAEATARAGRPGVVAICEALNDHENLGALFRNAAAFGLAGVLLDPTTADPFYRRSVRVSLGQVCSVPSARLTPWPAALESLGRAGVLVAALTPRGGRSPRTTCTLAELAASRSRHRAVAVLLGAEGPGLSDAALSSAEALVSIPMADGVDSLNVATAAALAFYALTTA